MTNFPTYIICCAVTLTSALQNRCFYMDYRGKHDNLNTTTDCRRSEVCRKNFKISLIQVPPYSTAGLLRKTLKRCCGKCLNMTFVHDFTNITEVTPGALNSSDFIVPVLGKSSAVTLYGYYYIPLVDAPNVFYFTPKYRTVLENLFVDCLNLYPLVILCLLLAVISGFIVWIIETWYNMENYPRSFFSGLFEGFWYSFVSMTTVGYGDKTVKSIPARIFSVIWILIGIIMFGFLTSTFTSALMNARQPLEHKMSGVDVGVLQYRPYDASLTVKHEGIIKETSAWNFYADVLMLVRMLRMQKIHGFVLDKYTLAYTSEYLGWKRNYTEAVDRYVTSKGEVNKERKADVDFFFDNTYRSLKTYHGEKLSYGVLVKNSKDYYYFRDVIKDNRLSFETSVESAMNALFPHEDDVNLFAPSGSYFRKTVIGIGAILCGICCFGMFYEFRIRTKGECSVPGEESDDLTIGATKKTFKYYDV